MSNEAVARRYARAIFEIGREEGSLARLALEVASFSEVYVSSLELRNLLEDPLVREAAREAVLKDIGERLGLSPTAENALRLLTRRRRIGAIAEISRELRRLVDEESRLVRAHVISAAPLSEDYLGRLKAQLEKATGKNVALTTELDPTLIAGVITRIGDRVIDGSVLSRLRTFRESLITN